MEIVVMTMKVTGLTHKEFRAILDEIPEGRLLEHP